ncbi:unnamed protein product [Lactuca virosa]|uniref:Uncharacterized protein n=1 Tax=Lactuca virosa TaxID=75947 RepID=A0AAU9NEC1_9ASTR|nr:unnamed protein product [Lactuca virosa]
MPCDDDDNDHRLGGVIPSSIFMRPFCNVKLLIPFCNVKLLIPNRAHDVVSRLTLDEKFLQLVHGASGIPRLGISAYERQ